MAVFETLLVVLLGAVLLSLVARRLKLPYPAFLALGGALAAFLPFAPRITIEPELVLALFVAPVLLDAAFDSSPRDLKRNALPIAFLGVAAVGVTIAAVAFVARQMRPDLPWAATVALGAIVAPPDASAATTVLRAVPVPHRVKVILEGESLFNDATALIVYRLAVAAVGTSAVFGWSLLPTLALATAGSAVFGAVLAWVFSRLIGRLTDAPSAIIIQFITTFGVWIAAEALHLSAIVTIVVYAMVIARLSARRGSATLRAPAYAVWETVVFGLNALAFALTGLAVGPIVSGLRDGQLASYAGFAVVVVAATVGVRMAWVLGYNLIVQAKNRLVGARVREGETPPTFGSGVVIGWAGMRGVVTLATANALPAGFPERDLILVSAFAVVLATLVVQGLTLGLVVKAAGLKDDGLVAREIRGARRRIAEASLAVLKGETGPAADRAREEYDERLRALESADDGEHTRPETEADALKGRLLEAKRKALLNLRHTGEIGDDAYFQLEEELDRTEVSLAPVER